MNKDDIEILLEELQKKIEYEEKVAFSKVVINEFRNPSNFGIIDKPGTVGKIKGPCGETMVIMLNIKDNKLIKVGFWTDGCGPSIACGSMLTKMIRGKNLNKVLEITSEDLNKALDGLPDEHIHCTVLAVNTLKKAINNYHKNEKN